MNAACSRITGYQFADTYSVKRSPRELISVELSDADYEVIQKQLKSGKPWNGEVRNRHKSGKVYWEQILALHTSGHTPEALARLGELHDLRDDLLHQLESLVQEVLQ